MQIILQGHVTDMPFPTDLMKELSSQISTTVSKHVMFWWQTSKTIAAVISCGRRGDVSTPSRLFFHSTNLELIENHYTPQSIPHINCPPSDCMCHQPLHQSRYCDWPWNLFCVHLHKLTCLHNCYLFGVCLPDSQAVSPFRELGRRGEAKITADILSSSILFPSSHSEPSWERAHTRMYKTAWGLHETIGVRF